MLHGCNDVIKNVSPGLGDVDNNNFYPSRHYTILPGTGTRHCESGLVIISGTHRAFQKCIGYGVLSIPIFDPNRKPKSLWYATSRQRVSVSMPIYMWRGGVSWDEARKKGWYRWWPISGFYCVLLFTLPFYLSRHYPATPGTGDLHGESGLIIFPGRQYNTPPPPVNII